MEETSNLLQTTNEYDNVLETDKQQCGSSVPIDCKGDDTILQPTVKSSHSLDASIVPDNVTEKLHWDASNANRVARLKPGEDAHDIKKIRAFLQQIILHKGNRYPSGLISKKGQAKIRFPGGMYREGIDFELAGILGHGTIAGDVMVIKDKTTGKLIAQKKVLLSFLRPEEIMAWMELEKTGYPPRWLLFQFETNLMAMYMDIVKHAIRLDAIINDYILKMDTRHRQALSLWMFDSLLAAVHDMSVQNWVHGDLHGGNLMIQSTPHSIRIRILDFGKAVPFDKPEGYCNFKQDIIQAMRHLSGLYIGDQFNDRHALKRIFLSPQEKKLWIEQIPLEGKEKEDFVSVMDRAWKITDAVEIQAVCGLVQSKIDQNALKQSIEVLFPNKNPVSLSPHLLHTKDSLLESSKTKQHRTSPSKSLKNRTSNFHGESEVMGVDENPGSQFLRTDNQICTSELCAFKIADLQATVARQEQELSLIKSNSNQSVEVDKPQGVPGNQHHTK